jgi:hypothetical protein
MLSVVVLSVVAPNMARGMTINIVTMLNYTATGIIYDCSVTLTLLNLA